VLWYCQLQVAQKANIPFQTTQPSSFRKGHFILLKAEPLHEACQTANQTINTGSEKLAMKISGVQETRIMVEFVPIRYSGELKKTALPLI
jgi:hypothetical protein